MTLVELSLHDFTENLASDRPAPGGGSVAALAGALAAALCAMVSRLTVGKEKYRDAWADMERVRDRADQLVTRLLGLVDQDSQAYNEVLAAFKMPKGDDAQKSARRAAIETAMKQASEIPMETLRTIAQLETLIGEVMDKGNPNCITDAGVAAQLIRTAAFGAAYNARINWSGINDKEFVKNHYDELSSLIKRIETSVDQFGEKVENALG